MSDWLRGWRLATPVVSIVLAAAAGPLDAAEPESTAHHRRYAARAALGARRGRPRKFDGPSRSVTLTLPEHVIAALQALDADLSRAVVRAARPLAAAAPRPAAELATYGNRAVIVVPQNKSLKARTGAELVPLPDGRALILLDEGMSSAQFELRLVDALAEGSLQGLDRALFEKIGEILRNSRRTEEVEVRERSLIVMQWKRPRAAREPRHREEELTG
jgi:hypothetical protein